MPPKAESPEAPKASAVVPDKVMADPAPTGTLPNVAAPRKVLPGENP